MNLRDHSLEANGLMDRDGIKQRVCGWGRVKEKTQMNYTL